MVGLIANTVIDKFKANRRPKKTLSYEFYHFPEKNTTENIESTVAYFLSITVGVAF